MGLSENSAPKIEWFISNIFTNVPSFSRINWGITIKTIRNHQKQTMREPKNITETTHQKAWRFL
jgi:hypothetical protein